MYLRVGRPIGWANTSVEEEGIIKLEFHDKYIMLDSVLYCIWLTMCGTDADEEAIRQIDEVLKQLEQGGKVAKAEDRKPTIDILSGMMGQNVAYHADSNSEMYRLIKGFKIVRNGFANIDTDAMANSKVIKHTIVLIDNYITVSDVQMMIWQQSNGTKTLEQIYNENFSDMNVSDFMNNLFFLTTNYFIFAI